MTFKEIQQGQILYILDKDSIRLKTAKVTSTLPHIETPAALYTTQSSLQLMRDITIEEDGTNKTYSIPEHLSITYAGNKVLATNSQLLTSEVERMVCDAEKALSQVSHYEEVKQKAPDLLAQLNPAYKERMENDKRFTKIEESVTNIHGLVKQLLDKLN